jgi:hypothetical protein
LWAACTIDWVGGAGYFAPTKKTLSAELVNARSGAHRNFCATEKYLKRKGGRSSVVEFQPSKLDVTGSNPVARSK